MNTQELTILFQGPLPDYDLRYSANALREHFPDCKIILSTHDTLRSPIGFNEAFDDVVLGEDPGPLPSLKHTNGLHNNINRQIESSRAGLKAVTTTYCLRMRADMTVNNGRVLQLWDKIAELPAGPKTVGRGRMIVSSLFTLNPNFDQRMSYHVGDMMQLGYTEDLRRYYAVPFYDWTMATWYENRPYAIGTTPREREFRSRFAVEQWLAMHYLSPGHYPIDHHNDYSSEIISDFEERLVDNFVVFHPRDMNIRHPKFDWAREMSYFNAICYSFGDWLDIFEAKRGHKVDINIPRAWPSTEEDRRRYLAAESSTLKKKIGNMLPRQLRQAVLKRL